MSDINGINGASDASVLDSAKRILAEAVNTALGEVAVSPADFIYPPRSEMGDISLPGFALAKKRAVPPGTVMQAVFSALQDVVEPDWRAVTATAKVDGPYLNFKLKTAVLAAGIFDAIATGPDRYGANRSGAEKRVLIEYSNGNTHKEYHIGHLRNIAYGDAVTRILRANGYGAVPVSYVNDFGIHVAKTLWAYASFYKDEPLPDNKGEFLASVYVRANKEAANDPAAKGKIEFVMRKIESRQGEEYALWQTTREWSIESFDRIYRELGVSFDKTFYESEYIDQGKALIPSLVGRGVLKESQGAVIADLEASGLGVLVVLRSDGTATYPVADIPLAEAKAREFAPAASLYVVDIRQTLYFKQLFKILELMGHRETLRHLAYDFVKTPDGMMASRTGNVITYKELRDEIRDQAFKETLKRHPDWPADTLETVVGAITVGALKFEMLKVGADQVISYDIAKALSFAGNTAAYLQYTYARIRSIVRNAPDPSSDPADRALLADPREHALIIALGKYPDAVRAAGEAYDPSVIAKYSLELAALFNDFYHVIPVLKAETAVRTARLELVGAIADTLRNALSLLGIDVVQEM